jgi:hypothetical protein
MIARGDVRFHGLGKGSHDLCAILRRPEQQFIIGVAEIPGFEQHRWSFRTMEHVERREAVRLGPKLNAATGLADEAGGKVG